MSEEYVPTGHRIFRGGKHIEMEVISTEMKPFVIHQPGDMEAEVTASSSTPHDDTAEDIASRIAGDRKQFQADILNMPVIRAYTTETTGLGAAYLAGLTLGIWKDIDELRSIWHAGVRYEPRMSEEQRTALYDGWQSAVSKVLGWD